MRIDNKQPLANRVTVVPNGRIIYLNPQNSIEGKIQLTQNYVTNVLRWSHRYDLPPQVISDRILFRSLQRRRLLQQRQTEKLLDKLRIAFNGNNPTHEQDLVNDYTKRGFFYGSGQYRRIEY